MALFPKSARHAKSGLRATSAQLKPVSDDPGVIDSERVPNSEFGVQELLFYYNLSIWHGQLKHLRIRATTSHFPECNPASQTLEDSQVPCTTFGARSRNGFCDGFFFRATIAQLTYCISDNVGPLTPSSDYTETQLIIDRRRIHTH